ncbi:hypothetical protein SAMN02910398_00113 [Butyrivibrio sp. YAB3001]|nr:hypothetical protein SAMN02910398_00113 [Butyrivibrio sp. YAB3001]
MKKVFERGSKLNKKVLTKIVAGALSFALLFTVAPAVKSEAADNVITSSSSVYFSSKNISYSSSSFTVPNSNGKTIKTIKNLKTSNKNVAEPTGFSISNNSYHTKYYDLNGTLKNEYNSDSKYAYISYKATKPGKANFTYQIGKQKYKHTITVYAYSNPVSKLSIYNTSEKKPKNYAKLFNTSSYIYSYNNNGIKVPKNGKVKLSATAAKGWVITSMSIYNNLTDTTHYKSRSYSNGVNSASIALPEYSNKGTGRVYVNLRNTKTNGTCQITAYVNAATTNK